jgi:hypothetical protein
LIDLEIMIKPRGCELTSPLSSSQPQKKRLFTRGLQMTRETANQLAD